MPRTARQKDPILPQHIMCRAISDIQLFRNDKDKIKYLELLSIYRLKFKCSIISYCLMDTHLHLQLDPQGCDISKFMHCVNLCYAQYYNRKYKRRGPVFQNRFKNKIIHNDIYNLTVSAYIHNNPKDLPLYRDCTHKYYFSSYGIYLGIQPDDFGLIDSDFILQHFHKDPKTARTIYHEFVSSCRDAHQHQEMIEIIDGFISKEYYHYQSERYIYYRNLPVKEVIEKIGQELNIPTPNLIQTKCSRNITEFKAISIYILRCLCDYSYKDICKTIGNLSLSQVSNLSNKGFHLVQENKTYQDLFTSFLETRKVA